MTELTYEEDLPVAPAKAASILFYLIAGTLLALIIWASVAELDEVTRGQGRIIPSRQMQVIQNLEGGIVEDVLVAQGDQVSAGQVLMRLDTTQFNAAFTTGQDSFNALSAKVARLEAEADLAAAPVFDPALEANAPKIVATEKALFDARMAELASNKNVKDSILTQRSRALSEAQVAAATARENERLSRQEVDMLEPLVAKGIEPRIELLRAQQREATAKGDIRIATLAAERAQAALAEVEFELKAIEERFKAEAVGELTQARAELTEARAALPALQDRVTRTEVRAPIAGTVNTLNVSTIGAVVQPGETMIELVPLGDTLLVEAFVDPKDIAFLRPGQGARVTLSAYDFATYGALEGSLETISADAIEQDDGQRLYRITVRTQSDKIGDESQDLPILPGMVADVSVLGGKRTIMDYILSPITDISERALQES
ncbi:MAG: HlyD family type I secretion periplasmic adaptor subunit [Pseudomonadota bacterium]